MDKNKTDALLAEMNDLLGEDPEAPAAAPKNSPLNGVLTEVLESHGIKLRAYDPVTGKDITTSDNE